MWGVIAMASQTPQVPLTRQLSGSQCIWSSPQTHWDITLCLASESDVILYTGLGRKWGAREKMKRRSVNGVPNVPNLLVSFFVAQKEVANSKLHIPMNDTHFILNQKYFRNLKKRSKYCLFSSTDKIFSFSKYFPSLFFFSPACGPNIFFLFLPLYSSQQYISVHQ